MVRFVGLLASLLACSAPVRAQTPAPAPAAYQPAVLGEAPPAATAGDVAAAPASTPAAVSGAPVSPSAPAADSGAAPPAPAAARTPARFPRLRAGDSSEAERPIRHGDPRARWTLAVSLDSVFYTDSGYDLFDDDNVASRIGLWAAFDLVQLSPHAVLAVELGFGSESQERGIWQGSLQTRLESQTFSAGTSLRYALTSWLDPQLRASAGVTRLAFELDTFGDSGSFEDYALSGFGALGAGVMLHTPAGWLENARGEFASFNFGILIEGGYALRSSVDVQLSQKAGGHAIAISQADLGELALSGPYVRSSLLVRF